MAYRPRPSRRRGRSRVRRGSRNRRTAGPLGPGLSPEQPTRDHENHRTRLRPETRETAWANPVTGPPKLSRLTRTVHSQCIAPRGCFLSVDLISVRIPEKACSAHQALRPVASTRETSTAGSRWSPYGSSPEQCADRPRLPVRPGISNPRRSDAPPAAL